MAFNTLIFLRFWHLADLPLNFATGTLKRVTPRWGA